MPTPIKAALAAYLIGCLGFLVMHRATTAELAERSAISWPWVWLAFGCALGSLVTFKNRALLSEYAASSPAGPLVRVLVVYLGPAMAVIGLVAAIISVFLH